ncbi:MAG: hypothetical protein JKY71_01430 [Alphaproteobacteria bacterium]|nr:hypothetical protein [Alphaproteobacteria bacterium]
MSNLSIEDLKSGMCRWPHGDPEDDSFHFCGDRTDPELPYCNKHTEKSKSTYRKSKKN